MNGERGGLGSQTWVGVVWISCELHCPQACLGGQNTSLVFLGDALILSGPQLLQSVSNSSQSGHQGWLPLLGGAAFTVYGCPWFGPARCGGGTRGRGRGRQGVAAHRPSSSSVPVAAAARLLMTNPGQHRVFCSAVRGVS